jgi:mannose-6-phosphate isomerase-like protein (cupin superfamily)
MEQVWFIATHSELVVAQDDLSIIRQRVPAGDQPPLHVHHDEDEVFSVLSGEITLWVGDQAPVVLGPGESVLAPRGIPHTYRTDALTELFVITNGTFATFVRAAGTPALRPELPVLDGPPDAERLARLAAEHRITLLGPPGMLPADLVSAANLNGQAL